MNISKKAEEIFLEAISVVEDKRADFVAQACGDDTVLFKDVMSLLAAADSSDVYFDRLSSKVGLAALSDEEAPIPSDRVIGNWRVKHVVGRGGMGAVYFAERADEQFEQAAALKILPFGLDSDIARLRFLTERQILARLEHPNIARLLDGGVTEDDMPYFVMEFIDGLPIDEFCDRGRLGIRERIGLFIDVLAAVAHAHTQLVVHRDIKPSNVLVTRDGLVKLLDFGVAKMLSGDGEKRQTRELSVALTPEYAAPEQLTGKSISTATDVYSLGMLLFTLLVGRNPRKAGATDSLLGLQQMATDEPPRPSDFFDAEETLSPGIAKIVRSRDSTIALLRKNLRGDLDNILSKAIAVHPTDRYTTVADLAADLRRFLSDEPVLAQPVTVVYRVEKFVRRHRGGVLAGALTLTALIAAVVITGWQMVEANRQRDIAIYQQQRVQASNEFYGLLMEEMGSKDFTSLELLDQGRALLLKQFGADEAYMGSVLFEVSRRYGNLGERDRETELLEEAERLAREHEDDNLLATVLCRMARSNAINDSDRAARLLAEGTALFTALKSPAIETSIECLRARAADTEKRGDIDSALAIRFEAKELLDTYPAPATNLKGILLNDIGFTYFKLGNQTDAVVYLDEVLNLLDETGRGSSLGYQRVAANKAVVLANMGRVPEALDAFADLIRRFRESNFGQRGASRLFAQYGDFLASVGRMDEAEQMYVEGLQLAESVGDGAGAAHYNVGLSKVHLAARAFDAALERLDAAQTFIEGEEGADRVLAHSITVMRAKVLRTAGELDDAVRIVDALLVDVGYPEARQGPGLLSALIEGAATYQAVGNYARAEELVSGEIDRLQERNNSAAPEDVYTGRAFVHRAEIRMAAGNVEGAIDDLELALPHLLYALGEDHQETIDARNLLDTLRL